MKNRILTFIIGILVGSIVTILVFLIYIKTTTTNIPNGFNRGEFNENFRPSDFDMKNPPKMPNGNMQMQRE